MTIGNRSNHGFLDGRETKACEKSGMEIKSLWRAPKHYHLISHSVEKLGKRANLAVKGVMIDGEWVDDPSKVKDEFRDLFCFSFL
ncbi:hypothetical protein Tco_0255762 [Tanacetum coccineum]